jgi:hypothetical protein
VPPAAEGRNFMPTSFGHPGLAHRIRAPYGVSGVSRLSRLYPGRLRLARRGA